MSADNGIVIDLKTFKVKYYQGEGVANAWKCKTLVEAVIKAKDLQDEYGGFEYGIHFTGKLSKPKTSYIGAGGATFVNFNKPLESEGYEVRDCEVEK